MSRLQILIEIIEDLRPHLRALGGVVAYLNELKVFRATANAVGGFVTSLGAVRVGFPERKFSVSDFIATMGLLLAMYAIIAKSINEGYARLLGELRGESREKFVARRRVCIGTGLLILLFAGSLGVCAPLKWGSDIPSASIAGHLCGACTVLMVLYGVYLAMLFLAIHYKVNQERLSSGSAASTDGSAE